MTFKLETKYATYELTDEHGMLYEFLNETDDGSSNRSSYYSYSSRRTWHSSCWAVNRRGASSHISAWDFETQGGQKLQKQFPSPGVFVGTTEQLALAYLFDELERDSYVVFDPKTGLGHCPDDDEVEERVELLRRFGENLGAFIDARHGGGCSVSLTEKDIARYGHVYKEIVPVCNKELSAKHFLSYAKKRFVELAQDTWGRPFLMPTGENGGKVGNVVKADRAINLAYGLLVLDDDVYYPSGRGTGSKLSAAQNSALNHAVYEVEKGNDNVTRVYETLKHLRDYPQLWQKASSDTFLSIRLPETVLDDKDKTIEVFSHAADSLGLATLVDAYKLGISVEDLVGMKED